MSLKLVNAKLWLETGVYEGGLVTDNGAVSKIGKEHRLPSAETIIDAGGKLVIPGLVDLHVHFREPGFTQKEDFSSGTRSAAAGGVTTVLDEPNNNPVTASVEALKAKQGLVQDHAYVDYLFNMAVYAERLNEIRAASNIGVNVFAFFDELGDKPTGLMDTGVLYDALRRVDAVNGLALLNCRESDHVLHTIKKLKESGKNTLQDYNNGFPHVAESVGAAKRILLAHSVGVRTHLREVSTAETADVLRSLKPYMADITAEVRPDHLFLNQENTKKRGPYGQQWTPIRTKKDQMALWEALNDGTVDIIASDHATHMVEEKRHGLSNIWNSPPGLPAIESMLPLLLNAVHEGKTRLDKIVQTTSVNPAKRLGLYPRKGCIDIGSDADLVILDLDVEKKITADTMFAKPKWTPYEGWRTVGALVTTIVRGVPVFQEGEIVSEPIGQYVSG
ncbi:MAG: dihydroorotase family protein [Candidatus Bathyarchaeota archaeon]|nr:dihydroorotase family protein [Candidatus Bathyarchaeota archaeon]